MSWMGLTNAEEMLYEQLKTSQRKNSSLLNVSDYSDYDENESISRDIDISEYQKIITKTGNNANTIKKKLNHKNNELLSDDGINEEIEDHSRHFIAMEMEEIDAEELNFEIKQKAKNSHNLPRILKKAPKTEEVVEDFEEQREERRNAMRMRIAGTATEIEQNHGHSDSHNQSKCGRYFNYSLFPFHIAFKYSIPKTNRDSSTPMLSLSFFLVLVWLAILTFICVDSAEKMGNCLKISEDVMGLTILAIGSSLPDCFSSILAAKQGKGEMAVSNALGSNVFDINICIGVSFLVKSIISGFKSIIVEHDEGFELFIAALFVLLALFMVTMFCYGLVLNKTIGAGLMAAYAVFLGAFCYLLQYD